MYEVGVVAQFEAAHQLVGDFGPATRMHGHTYRMEVIVRGARLKEDGTLYDIGALREVVDGLAASLNYRDLGDVPGLGELNTTAENVASFCWDTIAETLVNAGLDSLVVRIWESPLAWAARDEPLTAN